jgi:EpsI family protein
LGHNGYKRIIILIIILIFAGVVAVFKPVSNQEHKKTKLESVLSSVPGWEFTGSLPLDQPIMEALQLDDYVNMSFSDKEISLNLYIGYYYSAKKIGAAHDPLVCFPGQGWNISDKKTRHLTLKSGQTIDYSTMIGQLGDNRQLITYWFQSYDKTNASTFNQKLSLFRKKLLHKGEDNAFVRITVPIGTQPMDVYSTKTEQFINAFYPEFLSYIKDKP